MAEQQTKDTLLRELRRLNLYPPEAHQLKELRSKLDDRIGYTESSHADLDLARYSVLLHGLVLRTLEMEAEGTAPARSKDESDDSVEFICIDSLAELGLCGRVMAADLLCNRKLSFSKVKKWFGSRPVSQTLGVADRMLALSPEKVQERIAFAREVLSKASTMDRSEAVDFFNSNGTRKGQLTFTTLENFIAGTYGAQCRKSLTEPETLEEISECADSMPSYPEKQLISDVAFHLRTKDPMTMRKVLRAVERLADEVDDQTMKTIVPLAMSPSLFLAKAAMDVIAKFGGSRRGRIFARIFNESTQTRAELINRLPLLGSEDFALFMNNISKKFHVPVIATLCSTLAEEDPETFGTILGSVLKSSKSKRKTQLSSWVNDIIESDSLPEPARPVMGSGRTMQGDDFVRLGAPIVLNIMKKKSTSSITRIFGQDEDASDADQDIYSGGTITSQRIHKLNRWKSRAHGIFFKNCTFSACDMSSAFFEQCEFINCVFESSSFAETTFLGCRFVSCSFVSSSLQESLVYNCRFKHSTFKYTHFESSKIVASKFNSCEFNVVSAPGTFLSRVVFEGCGFNIADLREVYFHKCGFSGVVFSYSDFENAYFNSGAGSSVEFSECFTFDCRAVGIKTGSQVLLRAMNKTLYGRLSLREKFRKKGGRPGGLDQYERGVVYKAVKRWFVLKDVQRAHGLFSENNERRLRWAGARMDEKGRTFFNMLPALIHTDVFEHAFGIEDMCVPARIKGYNLSLEASRSLASMFRVADFDDDSDLAIPVEALMSIGSTGTIAQSSTSDLDCWVCCDFSKVRKDSRERLMFKLSALEDWAGKEFGLEVHFFVMDVREVRDNRFGISDEESSGSAQSAILKEEFYRTALLIAGKPPLWWFSPVDAGDSAYAETRKKVAMLKGREFAVDLGNVPRIKIEEFFGASLWQIVKGVKSPFKSIMKFGLLEMYTSGEKNLLLCESIKSNILQGMRRLRKVDPYMLLYKDLADFYTKQGKLEYTWLTAMALRLKCGLLEDQDVNNVPGRPEEREIINFATGLAGENSPGKIKGFKDLSDFRSVVALGEQINQFMIKTYTRIRGEQDKLSGVAITPEDLTRLGRVIFSNFAKRENKVERISLPGSATHFFDSLIVTLPKNKKWEIQGEYSVESGSRVKQTRIASGKELVPMLVWAALNGIYTSGMKVRTDMASSPVRDRELAGLFEKLIEFFPPDKIFNAPVDEALNPEQMVRAYFVLNFCMPREDKRVKEVYLVYSTNWGEVFCRSITISPTLVEAPEKWLKTEMAEICSGPIKMRQFVPQSSVCQFLKIPVD